MCSSTVRSFCETETLLDYSTLFLIGNRAWASSRLCGSSRRYGRQGTSPCGGPAQRGRASPVTAIPPTSGGPRERRRERAGNEGPGRGMGQGGAPGRRPGDVPGPLPVRPSLSDRDRLRVAADGRRRARRGGARDGDGAAAEVRRGRDPGRDLRVQRARWSASPRSSSSSRSPWRSCCSSSGCVASTVVTWAYAGVICRSRPTPLPFIVTTWVAGRGGGRAELPRVELPPPPNTFDIVTARSPRG